MITHNASRLSVVSRSAVAAAVLVSLGLPLTGRAAVIATYWFPGGDPSGDATVPTTDHVTFTAASRHGLVAVPHADDFASTDYTSSPTIDLNDSYVEFSITAAPGYRLKLEGLTFYFTRVDQNMNRTGPQNGTVRASFENFLSGSGTGDDFLPTTTEQHTTWDFTDYTSPDGGSATFRIYGWNSIGNPSGSMQLIIDDIYINGSVVPNPEPTTLVALSPLGALRRRRRV